MRLSLVFAKRNALEMLRDPIIYIFCLGFPIILLILFSTINAFTNGGTPMFEPCSIVPGVITFGFTFVLLVVSMLVSKDRTSALVIRLFSSPLKSYNFVLGYFMPCVVIGIVQSVICIAGGGVVALITNAPYFSFGAALLLILANVPILLMCIALGVSFGSLFNDRSSSGMCSIIISTAGVLCGAWMPIDTMGGFEIICRVLPFYPTVYIGKIITGALHTMGDVYTFDGTATIGLITIALYTIAAIILSITTFTHKSKI
jgi:ABC-2 type transport system permease protein